MTTTRFALWGFTLVTLGMTAAAAAPAIAAPGALDPNFGDGGIRLFGSQTAGLDLAEAMLVQPDGKLVIAGNDKTGDFLVRRLRSDGSPDRTFGGDGTASADFAGGDDVVTGIALQGDGKLVVAGRSVGIGERAVVARFTAGATLDPAFGAGGTDGDGRVTLGVGQVTDVHAVAILPGGGIALAGTTAATDGDFGVTRLRGDGSVDAIAYEPVPSAEGTDRLRAAARTADGKLLVAGSLVRAAAPGGEIAGVARYGGDGKLDRTFGNEGLATVPGMALPDAIVPAGGGLLLSGTSLEGDTSTVVARLDAGGKPDKAFGSAGIVDVGFPGLDIPAGMGGLPDGRILVGATLGTELAFGAARLRADGRPDERYGEEGIAMIPVGERAISTASATTADGSLVLAGPAVLPGPVTKLAVARLEGDPPPAGDPSTGDPGAGDPQPAADVQPPVLTGLRVSRKVAGARPRIRFTLSEPARVRLTLKRRHGRARTSSVDAGAGPNRLRSPRRLVRGRYRLTAVAADAAGNVAPPVHIRFAVSPALTAGRGA
jgi:uncharacterized delta-60 repeat protein